MSVQTRDQHTENNYLTKETKRIAEEKGNSLLQLLVVT